MMRHVLATTALVMMAACAGSYDYVGDAPPAAAPAPPPPASVPDYVPAPSVQSAPLAPPAATPAPQTAPRIAQPPAQTPAQAPVANPPSAASDARIVAPNVAAPPPPRRAPPPSGDVVVPGTVERQVLPPTGDPRSVSERARDIRAWDDCVMHAQNQGERDPTRPALDQPEDVCRAQLGMASRNAVPDNRRP